MSEAEEVKPAEVRLDDDTLHRISTDEGERANFFCLLELIRGFFAGQESYHLIFQRGWTSAALRGGDMVVLTKDKDEEEEEKESGTTASKREPDGDERRSGESPAPGHLGGNECAWGVPSREPRHNPGGAGKP